VLSGLMHMHPVLGVQDNVTVFVQASISLVVSWPLADDDQAGVFCHHWNQESGHWHCILSLQAFQFNGGLDQFLGVEREESFGAEHLDQIFASGCDGLELGEVDTGLADVVLDLGEVSGNGAVKLNKFWVGHAEILVLGSGGTAFVLGQREELVGGASLGHPQSQDLDTAFFVELLQVLSLSQQVPDAFGLGLDDSQFDEGGVVDVGVGVVCSGHS